jgi:hypothetical protein
VVKDRQTYFVDTSTTSCLSGMNPQKQLCSLLPESSLHSKENHNPPPSRLNLEKPEIQIREKASFQKTFLEIPISISIPPYNSSVIVPFIQDTPLSHGAPSG